MFTPIMSKWRSYVLALGCWISLSITCPAQTRPPTLDKSIRLRHSSGTLGSVLEEINRQTGLSFAYSDDVITTERLVEAPAGEKTVKEILDAVLRPLGFTYNLINGQVILRKGATKPKKGKSKTAFTISGYVREKGSGEWLIGANVYLPLTGVGTTTNKYGFFSLTLPTDSLTLTVSFVGYAPVTYRLALDKDLDLNVDLSPETMLQEVVVTEKERSLAEVPQMSSLRIPISQIQEIPAFLGEKDVLKVFQLMPGVKSGSEARSGLYVRGGGLDQNLIILDDAVVYNASHLFGFFSVFNADALRSVELIKGGFPARFGGRLSSVLDMNLKEGNKERLHGTGGIGLVASRLTLEGPLVKEKASFLVSGRRTYLDVLSLPFQAKNERLGYYFYDLNAKANYDFGRNNRLFLSGYFGQDKFYLEEKGARQRTSKMGWGNATATLRWNHLFNKRLFANTSLIYSQYRLDISLVDQSAAVNYRLTSASSIRDWSLKYDLDYLPTPRHHIKAGVLMTHQQFAPTLYAEQEQSIGLYNQRTLRYQAWQSGVFAEDEVKVTERLRLNAGVRLSHFHTHGQGYFGLEPRLSVGYQLQPTLALKASFATMNQYVHLLTSSGIGLTTDLWVPATRMIPPQQSDQVALGLAKEFTEANLVLTLESYYKRSAQIIGYREGATFLSLEKPSSTRDVRWEKNVASGRGWAKGVEVLLQRKRGRLSGWLGYTLSSTELQFDEINGGKKFFARYDRRHDASLVGIFQLANRTTLSGSWVYGTGNALTLPTASYATSGPPSAPEAQDFTSYNGFRGAAYHRLDLSIQFRKPKKWGERTWEISIYNAYNRRNVLFYKIAPNDAGTQMTLRQVSLFGIIPSVSYNFKF